MCHLCGDGNHIADWMASDNVLPGGVSVGGLSATGGTAVGATANQNVNGLLGGVKWNSVSVDYNFPALASHYVAPYGLATGSNGVTTADLSTGFVAASESFKSMTRTALAEFSAVTSLVFNEVAATAASNISVARTTQLGSATPMGFGGYGYYPGSSQRAGDIWFSSSTSDVGDAFILGRGTYTLVLHELGHAMGLKHGHQTGGPANTAMQAAFDFNDYSIMSYRREQNGATSGLSTQAFSRPQSLMMFDILTLQTMYGANYNTNSGNTVYRFSPTTGQMFVNGVGGDVPGGGAVGANRIYRTIWDGGGIDTYDFSNYTTNLSVDLTPGGRSTLDTAQLAIVNSTTGGLATGNVFNALMFNGDTRSLIENAIGGTGNDTIVGNAVGNGLFGGGGDDLLFGDAGLDFILAGDGNDVASGGSERDLLYGEAGLDVLFGDGGDDFLAGGADRDGLYSGSGFDVLFGGDGDDVLSGDGDRDWVYGEAGLDLLFGGDGDDVVAGGAGADTVIGGTGADALFGEAGDDFIFAEDGNDFVVGGAGYNQISLAGGLDIVLSTNGDAGTQFVVDFSLADGDQVWLVGSGYADAAAALAAASNIGGATYIPNGNDAVYIASIAPSQLSAANIVLL